MNTNVRRIGIFFLVAFAILIADVTYWQVIDASNLQSRSDNGRLFQQAQHVQRGFILDRNGVVLAGRSIDPTGIVHRTYADPSLSQVIGYDNTRYGKTELEKAYDPYLAGQIFGPSWKSQINQWEHQAVVGDNITLSIDDKLQQQVAAALPDGPSAAIVADPRDGEIYAMASKPTFDANRISDPAYWSSLLTDPGLPLINRPVNGYYVPGSTFKLVTLTAAIDTGTMSLSQEFFGTDALGPLTVGFHTFPDTINNLAECGQSPPVDLATALACSDNIVFARVGLAVGATRWLDYAHRFGLDQPVPFDIPVFVSHTLTPGETFSPVDLAASSFGQGGLHVTPLQMLMIAEAQANHGDIPQPVLVRSVTTPDGTTVKSASYGSLYHVESSATADQVRDAMVEVVQKGSGYAVKNLGVSVAAKTGTAETGDGKPPHAWFVCFAPADHPRIAVVVMVEHGGEGAIVAAPIARRILQAALPAIH